MDRNEYRIIWNVVIRFVDDFRRNTNMRIKKPMFDSDIANAFYAGVVEYISNEQNVQAPKWVYNKEYYLSIPFFAGGFKSLEYRILTMIETPVEFKTRNIFLGENTFSRC